MSSVCIILPPPNPVLHAHNKGHWREKQRATQELRTLSRVMARDFVLTRKPWPRARIDYWFYVPDRRRRDVANMIQSQKAAIDGIVDSGLIKDDDWQHLEFGAVTVNVDKVHPRVEVRITEVAG